MTETYPKTFLLELMTAAGELEEAELYARMGTAVEKAYLHAKQHCDAGLRANVSANDAGEIDGIGFFCPVQGLLACVTVYCLENDLEEPTFDAIHQACNSSPAQAQALLAAFLEQSSGL